MRHKWKPLDARRAVCERCGAGMVLRKRPGTVDLYDRFFQYPKGGELFIQRGVKIPPCDGGKAALREMQNENRTDKEVI